MDHDPLLDAPLDDATSPPVKIGRRWTPKRAWSFRIGVFLGVFLVAFFPIRYLFCGMYCSTHEFPRWIIFGLVSIFVATVWAFHVTRKNVRDGARVAHDVRGLLRVIGGWLLLSAGGVFMSVILTGFIMGAYAGVTGADIDCEETAALWAIGMMVFFLIAWSVYVYFRSRPKTWKAFVVLPLQLAIFAAGFFPLILILSVITELVSQQTIFGWC